MTRNESTGFLGIVVVFVLLACFPLLGGIAALKETITYMMGLAWPIAMYTVLATSWSLFSGPTHYISLATAAFYGLGSLVVAVGVNVIPYPVLVGLAGVAGAGLALLVGLATLRLSGVYFVIFTLGLAELIRQLVSWTQNNITHTSNIMVVKDISDRLIFWQLLALAAAMYLVGWLVARSRLGFALRIIGNDEVVAAHSGIHSARAKVILFMISGVFAATVGGIMIPKIVIFDPNFAFSAGLSFQVVIMALLGGVHRLWGPLVGVVPFTLLWEFIEVQFKEPVALFGYKIFSANSLQMVLLGVCFLLVVYYIPHGVVGRLEAGAKRLSEMGGRGHG